VEWFKGSTTNLAFNALDVQIEQKGKGDQVAVYCERNAIDEAGAFQVNKQV
jgi:acyl-coenzyme A synthetase/AMP-(fatty) acid ligase